MKIYYRPPKVKKSKALANKRMPEWNDNISDLNKMKLSSTEVVIITFLILIKIFSCKGRLTLFQKI